MIVTCIAFVSSVQTGGHSFISGRPGLRGPPGAQGPPGISGSPGEPGICPTYCALDGGTFYSPTEDSAKRKMILRKSISRIPHNYRF